MGQSRGGNGQGDPQNQRLPVIPEPAEGTRSILSKGDPPDNKEPFFIGYGGPGPNLLCGACDHILSLGLGREDIRIINLVLECPNCGAYNSVHE